MELQVLVLVNSPPPPPKKKNLVNTILDIPDSMFLQQWNNKFSTIGAIIFCRFGLNFMNMKISHLIDGFGRH